MANTALAFAAAFVALGLFGYVASDMASPTALIPAFFGLLIGIAGWLGRNESMRKHAMHAAAVLGLLGAGAVVRPAKALAGGAEMNLAIFSQLAMAVLSAIFLALCVRSFIAARRARLGGAR